MIKRLFRKKENEILKDFGKDLLDGIDYAKLLVRAEHMNLLRGKITKREYQQRINEIAEREYKKLKFRIRLIVSFSKFKLAIRED